MTEFYFYTICLLILFAILVVAFRSDAGKATIAHQVEYIDKKLIIDKFWVVMSFRANSLNCDIFEFLNANKNREVPFSELEEQVFRGRQVEFSKIVDSLGVRGDLKKVLFSFDCEKITYHPEWINSQAEIKIN